MHSRRFTLVALAGAIASTCASLGRAAAAAPSAAVRTLLKESEPAAVAVAYEDNAKEVNRILYPSNRRGQSCATCKYVELGTGLQRGCTLIPGRLVAAAAWCKLWKLRGTD